MRRLSLRWRIALTMGLLVFSASVLLTVLSIHNASVNFVTPLAQFSSSVQENEEMAPESGNMIMIGPTDGVHYQPEVKFEPKYAEKSFFVFSIACMVVITAVSVFAAYCLAGHAMRPIIKLNREVSRIDETSLSSRVSIPQTNDEVEILSRSFNQLLDRLEQAFERERRFSADVSHELKTPLATMITNAQVLKLSEAPTLEEYEENLNTTLQSARRLSDVVNGLLLLYQTKADIEMEPLSLTALFEAIQMELGPLYTKKNIRVCYDLEAKTVMGNAPLLYRALFNLMENAHKYMNEGGAITVTSRSEDGKIVLCITDCGIGIAQEDLNHIFEPFYRADKSRSRKISGAGLGLSITKEILALHQASICIDSAPNEGTSVEVVFSRRSEGGTEYAADV